MKYGSLHFQINIQILVVNYLEMNSVNSVNLMSEVRDIINKVAKLEKTESVTRYLDELHKYYKTLDNVPANLMNGNIKYNSID